MVILSEDVMSTKTLWTQLVRIAKMDIFFPLEIANASLKLSYPEKRIICIWICHKVFALAFM